IVVPGYGVDSDHLDANAPVRRVPPEATIVSWAQAASAAAVGDVVVFIDPSLVPIRGWLDALVANLRETAIVGAVTGVVLTASADGVGTGDRVSPTSSVLGIRADVLRAVGGLPPAAGIAEACAILAESLQDAG